MAETGGSSNSGRVFSTGPEQFQNMAAGYSTRIGCATYRDIAIRATDVRAPTPIATPPMMSGLIQQGLFESSYEIAQKE
jgi:hypothetical protein